MWFHFCRNRDSLKNGTLISIRRTGDGFHPGLFTKALGQIAEICFVIHPADVLEKEGMFQISEITIS